MRKKQCACEKTSLRVSRKREKACHSSSDGTLRSLSFFLVVGTPSWRFLGAFEPLLSNQPRAAAESLASSRAYWTPTANLARKRRAHHQHLIGLVSVSGVQSYAACRATTIIYAVQHNNIRKGELLTNVRKELNTRQAYFRGKLCCILWEPDDNCERTEK